MIEILRSNNPVELSWAQAVLGEAGIGAHLFDAFTSIVEGSIGAIPRRLMVDEDDAVRAARLLAEARDGLGDGGEVPG